MAEPSPDKIVIGAIGPLIASVIGAAIGWLPGGLTAVIGQPLTVLLTAVGSISGLVFSLMYKRYIGVLGAGGGRKGYPARDAYERLRASLSGGNLASRLYADWLTKFLDAVDRFFGDAGKADQTLFPHAFGLETPAPLWTAPAFDRCLLLALIYPIVTICIIWAVSGHIGPAETALRLRTDWAGWQRALTVGVIGVLIVSLWRATRTKGVKSVMWGAVAGAGASWFGLSLSKSLALSLQAFSLQALSLQALLLAALSFSLGLALPVLALAFSLLEQSLSQSLAFSLSPVLAQALRLALAPALQRCGNGPRLLRRRGDQVLRRRRYHRYAAQAADLER